ncbi:HNH endonuclease signature motif containing protein [uncultured Arthrobacter sp.]|uniref:HNH endonuclease signature motif containing protein n=1 Tax=uncultured Arthrobacter sp. TaxID=114050 RepID=UPI0026046786|nr:HNH endonuclease signature motif containing protein [uncultured Arthrobacter sp.]
MTIEMLETRTEDTFLLQGLHAALLTAAQQFESRYLLLDQQEAAATLVMVERCSHLIDHLQTLAARAAEHHQLAAMDGQEHHGSTAEYLRASIGISRSEANRRLRLGQDLLPDAPGPGASVEPRLATLAAAASTGEISSRAATVIRDAVHRVATVATRPQVQAMEEHLTRQAVESDEDILRVLARRWESVIDQDGREPTEKTLRARQGLFLRGKRHGLHLMEIGATDEQFEHLVTVMNTATNPRAGGTTPAVARTECEERSRESADRRGHEPTGAGNAPPPERPTRAQELLDGLVSACRIALAGDGLPTTGGHRPQVMVTINYRDLLSELGHDGHSVFAQQVSARSIRRIACDADILPLVLGGQGRILDVGRAQRLFPPHLRRALVARDRGCAFPDCTMPATWCEAHHIVPWAAGGVTSIDDGVLLCSRHHHLIHDGQWSVESLRGVPWFRPPTYLDPGRTPRRNLYWQVEEAVHEQLARCDIGGAVPCAVAPPGSPAGAVGRADARSSQVFIGGRVRAGRDSGQGPGRGPALEGAGATGPVGREPDGPLEDETPEDKTPEDKTGPDHTTATRDGPRGAAIAIAGP